MCLNQVENLVALQAAVGAEDLKYHGLLGPQSRVA
jgi:hypothetical protein